MRGVIMNLWEYIWQLPLIAFGIAAAIFVYFALSLFIQVKKKWWAKGFLLISCWFTSMMIIFTGDMVNLSFSICLFLIAIWTTCEGSGFKKITLGLMFSSTVSAFNGFYDNCVGFLFHFLGKDTLYNNMYLIGRFFFAVILYLIIRLQKPKQDFELSPSLWRLLLWLALPPFGIMIALILLRSPYINIGGTVLADSALFLMVMLSFTILLRALIVLENYQRLEWENALAMQKQRYYETMEQQQFEIRRLRHDLSNHLQILLALPGQQKDDYLKGLLENPSFGRILTWCGDATFNAVLTVKEELMRQNGIRFVAKVDIPDELPFEKADLCAILANALDNAVEGCLELAEDLREIHLNAADGKGVLAVSITNPCKNAANHPFFPKTTKKDAKNHGLGLRSIQETVKKYDGNMEIEQKEGNFHLFLYMPTHSCSRSSPG